MPEQINQFDLSRKLSGFLKRAAQGEAFLVVSRGVPVARIVPPLSDEIHPISDNAPTHSSDTAHPISGERSSDGDASLEPVAIEQVHPIGPDPSKIAALRDLIASAGKPKSDPATGEVIAEGLKCRFCPSLQAAVYDTRAGKVTMCTPCFDRKQQEENEAVH